MTVGYMILRTGPERDERGKPYVTPWDITRHPDARLIAAAPTLLTALRSLLEIANDRGESEDCWCCGEIGSHADGCEVAAAEAALRQAETNDDDETERLIAEEEDLRENWSSERYRGSR